MTVERGADLSGHTFGAECRQCGGAKCDHARYFRRRVAFILQHVEAYRAALFTPTSSNHELQRLEREYLTLPPRHDCTCICPDVRRGYRVCPACRALREQLKHTRQDIGVQIGHTSPVHAPSPDPASLDVLIAVSRGHRTPTQIARFLSEGE